MRVNIENANMKDKMLFATNEKIVAFVVFIVRKSGGIILCERKD